MFASVALAMSQAARTGPPAPSVKRGSTQRAGRYRSAGSSWSPLRLRRWWAWVWRQGHIMEVGNPVSPVRNVHSVMVDGKIAAHAV